MGTADQSGDIAAAGQGDYVVQNGDCIQSIAARHGFFWETLWNHPDNAELKRARTDPLVLLPGDRVAIPPKQEKTESGGSESRHRFKRRGTPGQVKLRFLREDEPRANVECIINIDGALSRRKTDAQGALCVPIPVGATSGTIQVGEGEDAVVYDLLLGHLDPHDSVRGVQQRLRNLGFYAGGASGEWDHATVDAFRAFQRERGLAETESLDAGTCAAIRDQHGS